MQVQCDMCPEANKRWFHIECLPKSRRHSLSTFDRMDFFCIHCEQTILTAAHGRSQVDDTGRYNSNNEADTDLSDIPIMTPPARKRKPTIQEATSELVPTKQFKKMKFTVRKRERDESPKKEQNSSANSRKQQQEALEEQPFSVVLLDKRVRRCYGCKKKFSSALRKAPFDLVLKYLEKRSYRDSTGSEKLSSLKQYTYYHLNLSCIRRNYPWAELLNIVAHDEVKDKLTREHQKVVRKFGLNL